MGILGSLFGGGTSLEISLDRDAISGGEQLTGTVTVRGGKKAAQITALEVKVMGVRVASSRDFDYRIVFDGAIAQSIPLPAGQPVAIPLALAIPADADPGLEFQLAATADIPGVADPSAKVEFRVIGRDDDDDGDATVFTADEVLERWEALAGDDAEAFREEASELVDAREWADVSAGGEVLARRFRDGDPELRDAAIWWYAKLLGPTDDLAAAAPLCALADTDDEELAGELASAAGALGPAGEEVLAILVRSPSAQVRRRAGFELVSAGGPRQRTLAEQLMADPDPGVVSSGVKALGGKLLADPAVVARLVDLATTSDVEALRAHALYALGDAPDHGADASALSAFAANARHSSDWIRATVGEYLPKWPSSPPQMQLVEQLATDDDSHVRAKLMNAFHRDCPAHLRPLWERVAATDPDDHVREMANQALRD